MMADTITFRINPGERRRLRDISAAVKESFPYRGSNVLQQTRALRIAMWLATRALDVEISKDKRRAMLEEALDATSQWGRLEEADRDARGL